MRMSGGRFHRHPGVRVVFPFPLRFPGHRVRPPSFPSSFHGPPSTRGGSPVSPPSRQYRYISIGYWRTLLRSAALLKKPSREAPKGATPLCRPNRNTAFVWQQAAAPQAIEWPPAAWRASRPYASRRRASLRTQNASHPPNGCSDFIYRAPVSLIKKPCYDRIYGLSRTMRCFMIQGGFMLMIRSGLPSGPLSGHLSAPSAPAALDTPIFLAPRPIHRLLVHLHFEIVTSRRQCAGKNCRYRIRYVRKPLEKDG